MGHFALPPAVWHTLLSLRTSDSCVCWRARAKVSTECGGAKACIFFLFISQKDRKLYIVPSSPNICKSTLDNYHQIFDFRSSAGHLQRTGKNHDTPLEDVYSSSLSSIRDCTELETRPWMGWTSGAEDLEYSTWLQAHGLAD